MRTADQHFSQIQEDQNHLRSLISTLDAKIENLGNLLSKADGIPDEKTVVSPPPIPAPPVPGKEFAPATKPVAPAPGPKSGIESDALEMQFGQVWLVRIGVVLLITALVYGSKLAYTHFVTDLPAAGKAALCFLFSGTLLGLGHWLGGRAEKNGSSQNLKNYARVVAGGGLAALYFTTFAIHRIEPLRIIESPLVAGALLFACAIGTLVYALKKHSRTVASTAVALGYYASMTAPAGGFALFSTLLLTGLGVAFLFRARWGAIGFLCLGGTYAALFYWQFLQAGAPSLRLTFLAAYWGFFTAGSILPKPDVLPDRPRLLFASINNALAFLFGSIVVLSKYPDHYGHFCLVFGAALAALAAVARVPLSTASLAKGIGLITLGWTALYDGYQLALVLGVQSAALFAAHLFHSRRSKTSTAPVVLIASLLALAGATFIATATPALPVISGIFIALIGLALAHGWNRFAPAGTDLDRTGGILCTISAVVLAATVAHQHLSAPHAFAGFLVFCCAAVAFSLWKPAKLPHLKFVAGAAGVLAPLSALDLNLHQLQHISLIVLIGLAGLSVFWDRAKISDDALVNRARHIPAALGALGFLFFSIHTLKQMDISSSGLLVTCAVFAPVLAFTASKLRAPSLYFGALFYHVVSTATVFDTDLSAPALVLPLGLLAHAEITRRGSWPRLATGLQIAAALSFCFVAQRLSPEFATLITFGGALALFSLGFALRRADTRRIALGTIVVALGRILFSDLWTFGTAGRVITLFALGTGLLVLGYLYNRHAPALKKLL